MIPSGRLEVLLEQIRDALQKQAESIDGLYFGGIEEQLIELNKTMKSINTYLSKVVGSK